MKLHDYLATPYPQHSFAVDEASLAYARLTRNREAFERTEQVALPAGWCALGPIGLLQVEREALAVALERLLEKLDRRPQRANVIIPNGWIRAVSVDVGSLPSHRQEAEEVIRWRLKKLLPCRPEDVRLDYLPAGDDERVLVALTLDRPVGLIEDTFAGAGVRVGRVVPSALALTSLLPAVDGTRLLVVAEEGMLALVGIADGAVRLLRNKGLPRDEQRLTPHVHRELGQTVDYLRRSGGQGVLEVHLASTNTAATEAVTGWALDRADVLVRPFPGEALAAAESVSGGDLRAWLLLAAGRERVR